MSCVPAEHGRPASLRFAGFGWRPSGRLRSVVCDLDLAVEPGERVLLTGPNGSGKSTLLRAAAGVLGSDAGGDRYGRVLIDGAEVTSTPPNAGLVLQNPADAVVADRVGRDVAFGPENLGLPRQQIAERVTEALRLVRFEPPPQTPTRSLSGGEAQRLALAGALAMRPGLLLLDEPTAMLDRESAQVVRAAIIEVVAATGATLVVVEHRIGPWLDLVDRMVVLDAAGRVVCDDKPLEALAAQAPTLERAGLWLPDLPPPQPLPVDPAVVAPAARPPGDLLRAEALEVRLRTRGLRGRREVVALRGVDAAVTAGVVRAFSGASGAGKSTLLAALAGLLPPSSGGVRASSGLAGAEQRSPSLWSSAALAARVGWVPQVPEHGFVTRTVADEVTATAARLGRRVNVPALLAALRLERLAGADPYRLSGGEQRRLGLLAALAHRPAVALFDEPTVGQDRHTWVAVAGWVAAMAESGCAVGVATHDDEFVRGVASDALRLRDGQLIEC